MSFIFIRFLWRDSRSSTPIYWKTREIVEFSKGQGGLGVRNVHLFDNALLFKEVVLVHSNCNSWVVRVLSSKYKGSKWI